MDEYTEQLKARIDHFERLERLQNRRAEIAIRLLRCTQKNPNLLSGRRRVREFLRKHWDVMLTDPSKPFDAADYCPYELIGKRCGCCK